MFTIETKHFTDFLDKELSKRSWTRAELSRRAHVSQSFLSMVWSGEREAGADVLVAIAHALDLPIEVIYRAAGLLPPNPAQDDYLTELLNLWPELTQPDKDGILDLARGMARRNRDQNQAERWANFLASLSPEERKRFLDEAAKLGGTRRDRKD